MVEPEDLAKIPPKHRHLIGLWLTERAAAIEPSWIIPGLASTVREVMWGVAVDLVDPLAEDSTLRHADDTLSAIGAKVPIEPAEPRSQG